MKTTIHLLIAVLMSLSSFSQDISGSWTGELAVQGTKLKLNFNIDKDGSTYKATMDSPSQGAYGIPASNITFTNSVLEIEIGSAGISYTGKLIDDANIDGKFIQGGQQFDLDLTRSKEKATGPIRPQEPKKPYSYISTEVSFVNAEDNITLKGTLTTPKSGSNFPAVILVSGSGAQNRDEELMGHKPFLVLADFLTRNGIAVLRYDDRGTAESGGDFSSATTHDFAKDAKAAVEFLRKRDDINHSKIGVVGHSEGGAIAPMLASKDADIAYIILMAGPILDGKDLMLLQKYKIEAQMGVPKSVLDNNNKIFSDAYDILIDKNLNGNLLRDSLSNHFQREYAGALPKNNIDELVSQLTNIWWRAFISLKPAEYLKEVKCPTLAIFGGKDLQVPSKENIENLETLASKNSNMKVEIKEFKDLNHLFQECTTGMPNEYAQIEQTMSPKVLELIKSWILKR